MTIDTRYQHSLAIDLLRVIGSPFVTERESSIDSPESDQLYHYAIRNKISLLYLRSLKEQGELDQLRPAYNDESNRYMSFLHTVAKVSQVLDSSDIRHAVFKSVRPYPTVPSDVDVMVFGDNYMYEKSVLTLLKNCYKPLLSHLITTDRLINESDYSGAVEILTRPTYAKNHVSPTGCAFVGEDTNIHIDLQKDMATSYVVYMDKNRFEAHTITQELSTREKVVSLTPELDSAVMIAHSVFGPMYYLGEFYTLLYHLSAMNDSHVNQLALLLRENRLECAARAFVNISADLHNAAYGSVPERLQALIAKLGTDTSASKMIRSNNIEIPFKYRPITVSRAVLEKFGEPRFRRSLLTQVVKMMNPKLTKLVLIEVIRMARRN